MPMELQNLKQWIVWRFEKEKGRDKPTKVPYQINGLKASSNNSNTWSTFEEVINAVRSKEYGFDGIGFMFAKDDNYIGIDIDNCYSEGEFNQIANDLMELLDSYSEFSPSGTGIHIIVKGQLPEYITGTGKKSAKYGLEIYSHGRFFTCTGNRENENEILERTDEIEEVFEKYFNREELATYTSTEFNTEPINLEEDSITWKKMFADKKNGSDIQAMYIGKLVRDNDHSSTDFYLCSELAFYCDKDFIKMDRMFRNSGLYRDKWDERRGSMLYGEMTLLKAAVSKKKTISDYKKEENDFHLIMNVKDSPSVDLQKVLIERRLRELEIAIAAWEEANGKGKKPSTISPIRCAIVLQEYISFVLFDLEENTRLAKYQPKEGTYTNNTTLIKRVISWLEPSFNEAKANEVIYHLTNQAQVKERTASRFLIPVKNGVFNLKTKTLEPFSAKYVFTSKIATSYVPNVVNPTTNGWDVESWLDSIACGDAEIVNLLWQVINDSLNGNYTRKKSIFLLGEGNNGKGTFQELITNLIGVQNIASLKVNEFDERFKLSLLEGRTAVIGDDVPANVYIDDSSNFNSVVTGDRVIVEQKNKPIYSTVFRCSVIQSTNGMPKFKNKTNGTVRRIVIVPFNADFNGAIENFKIKDEYIKHEEVLQYVLHKAINMDFEKFDIPSVSKIELEEFKQDNDPILDFKINVFDRWDLKEIPKYVVYGMYKSFCDENGYRFISDRKFHRQFKAQLPDEWIDGLKRFEWIELNGIGDLDRLGIGFPDKSKPQSTYKSEKLKIV
ncbi:DNA primase [Lysinibacillus contaminans]|uniref:DNA primase n=2 Tax=Lysinibacillus contaminans TaxID=1293441 RepID=A0ABR5K5V7_9BACI|nr:phage/plasmid primase, P4 family [Lysinibacillus contaminans]KOS71823.1 DNA primase [Lysinibacillus contaminans]